MSYDPEPITNLQMVYFKNIGETIEKLNGHDQDRVWTCMTRYHEVVSDQERDDLIQALLGILWFCEDDGQPVDGFMFRGNVLAARRLLSKYIAKDK